MPIATIGEEEKKPNIPAVTDVEEYQSSVVETSKTPISSLLQYGSGSPYTVKRYYSQVLGPDQAPRVFSTSTAPISQQYHMIENLRILVNEGLVASPIRAQYTFDIAGNGTITAGTIIPNTGDVMVVDHGDGREAIMSVGNATPLAPTLDTGHSIEWRVIAINDAEVLANLEQKVVRRSIYRQELLTMNKKPIISKVENDTIIQVERSISLLMGHWLNQFISRTTYILTPSQSEVTYDNFLVDAVRRLYGTWSHPLMQKITFPSLEVMDIFKTRSIWNILMDAEPITSSMVFKRAGTTRMQILKNTPQLVPLFYSKISLLVVPKDPPYDIDDEDSRTLKFTNLMNLIDTTVPAELPVTSALLNHLSGDSTEEGSPTAPPPTEDPQAVLLPVIKPVTVDDFYVFSEAFYTGNTVAMSRLEYYAFKMIQGHEIQFKPILDIIKHSDSWKPLERYYYIPILVMLFLYIRRR